ncbi:TPA: thioredoxin [Streptococcus suis]|uniref:thioredoxin n=1 Tax=Streptococcus suis TaxID=1307 RepID=UPI00209C1006|nr:thioredoxin [Streptococcus suis]MCO8202816.1 thioredoxin [Streptococcus suis]HEM3503021.1 thioredoxin [Streptococcus suis]
MSDNFRFPKMILGALAVIGILFFTVIGVQTVWSEYIVKDYDKRLTEQVYVDAEVEQNVNLVFYRTGCPYCEKGKQAVISAAKYSPYPTFFIDVESEDGQILVKKYQVEYAASIIKIRDGKSSIYQYAIKNKPGQIEADQVTIKEAMGE